jgi:hypothetical protein
VYSLHKQLETKCNVYKKADNLSITGCYTYSKEKKKKRGTKIEMEGGSKGGGEGKDDRNKDK